MNNILVYDTTNVGEHQGMLQCESTVDSQSLGNNLNFESCIPTHNNTARSLRCDDWRENERVLQQARAVLATRQEGHLESK